MNENIKKCLHDIKISIESIEEYVIKKDFNAYKNNKMVRRAVEREFEIIGEAMYRINKSDSSFVISGKHRIIGMRNRVIHGYDKIDNGLVWGTITRHLPLLKKEIKELLQH